MSQNLSSSQQKEINEVLGLFGLSAKEISVYLSLLVSGRTTITPLSQTLNLPVTTVQSVLDRLRDHGIVEVTKNKSRHVYESLEPKILKRILEEKIKSVSNIIPLLERVRSESTRPAKIKVYYRDRITDIFNEALKAKNKLVYEIVSAEDLQIILGEKYHFTRRRKENNIRLKSLRIEAHEIKKYSANTHRLELREAKFLPRELTFKNNIMFWDNTVAFFSSASEGLAWTVESVSTRDTFEQIFNLLWEISRRMETLVENRVE